MDNVTVFKSAVFIRTLTSLRFVVSVALSAALVTVTIPTSFAYKETKYAAFVVHADSGDILFDRYSNEYRYPASLTKMMTLYLLFEEIEAGRLTLKSKLPVSRTAAAQPPSKLGVRSGSTIPVETAIKSLIIKSANDVAVVVAEKIGGSEWKFAKLMTTKARSIGMRRTTFRNASGLPHSKQRTTARDMAELSRRLYQDFPQYRHYFSQKSFVYKKRTYTTHNSLVKTYPGADGMKTGYTRLSGYNLATTAARSDNRLIGIVLGGRSSYTRDKHMREILDTAFGKIKKQPDLISPLFTRTPAPRIKPSPFGPQPFEGDQLVANNSQLQATLLNARNGYGRADPVAALLSANASTQSIRRPSNAPYDQLATLISREDNSYAIAEGDGGVNGDINFDTTPVPIIAGEAFSVQIGAYSSQEYAVEQLESAATRAGLTETTRRIIPLESNQQTALFRARFFFADRQSATSGCNKLKDKGIGCFVSNEATGQF